MANTTISQHSSVSLQKTRANGRYIVPTGARFNRLVVLAETGKNKRGQRMFSVRCDCGTELIVPLVRMVYGGTKSCGCFAREKRGLSNRKHGMSRTPEFRIWAGIIDRCTNVNDGGFPHYGGRGITICDRWRNSFVNFYADMGPRPSPKHSVDRYPDNDGNYEPGNCRWATNIEQSINKRNTVRVTISGVSIPLEEACRQHRISSKTVRDRLKRGWTLDAALSEPPRILPVECRRGPQAGELADIRCDVCGGMFTPVIWNQVTCTATECRRAKWREQYYRTGRARQQQRKAKR